MNPRFSTVALAAKSTSYQFFKTTIQYLKSGSIVPGNLYEITRVTTSSIQTSILMLVDGARQSTATGVLLACSSAVPPSHLNQLRAEQGARKTSSAGFAGVAVMGAYPRFCVCILKRSLRRMPCPRRLPPIAYPGGMY